MSEKNQNSPIAKNIFGDEFDDVKISEDKKQVIFYLGKKKKDTRLVLMR